MAFGIPIILILFIKRSIFTTSNAVHFLFSIVFQPWCLGGLGCQLSHSVDRCVWATVDRIPSSMVYQLFGGKPPVAIPTAERQAFGFMIHVADETKLRGGGKWVIYTTINFLLLFY